MRLARSPGDQLRMTDLAAQTSLSTSGVTRVVDRLERDGLVRRRACPTDRRSSYAVVTPPACTGSTRRCPGHLEIIEQWFTGQLEPGPLDAHARRHCARSATPSTRARPPAAPTEARRLERAGGRPARTW